MADLVNETIPQNSESPTLGAQRIRETRAGFNDLVGAEHDISDEATGGFHGPNVTGKADTAITDPPTGYGRFGWKVISGVTELFYRDDAGNEKQITSAGKLNVAVDEAVLLTLAQAIAGVKTFSDSPVVPTPTTDLQASTKKYVDDSTNWSIDPMTGTTNETQGTITFPNGMIQKWGVTARTGDTTAVSFTVAFPNACFQVICANDDGSPSISNATGTNNIGTTGFTANNGTSGLDGYRWFAIGR